MNRRQLATVAAFASVLLSALCPAPAAYAGLQSWDLVFRDQNGAPTSAAKAQTVEAEASDSRGFTVSIGCATEGGYALALEWPSAGPARPKDQAIDPALRVSKPGTDLFRGPIGTLTYDGFRYTGIIPETALAPLRERVRDGLLTLTEFSTRTTISLKTADLSRALAEINCR